MSLRVLEFRLQAARTAMPESTPPPEAGTPTIAAQAIDQTCKKSRICAAAEFR
jgi:hypothetical protein